MQFAPKLQQIELRFADLERQLADPALIADAAEYRKAAKARSTVRGQQLERRSQSAPWVGITNIASP